MTQARCYGAPPPGVKPEELHGTLIVIEGPDSSGRSTQVQLLSQWLEQNGYAVAEVGIKRSNLVAPVLDEAQTGNVLSPRTMALFYATDFYDQLENRIVPALRAGYVVLADRYIFTLMARDMVRGAEFEWLRSLYSMAIVPDAVFQLTVSPPQLARRALQVKGMLDYWESGMDLGLSRDWFDSFQRYQKKLRIEFKRLQDLYAFEVVNGNRSVMAIHRDLKRMVLTILDRDAETRRNNHEYGEPETRDRSGASRRGRSES